MHYHDHALLSAKKFNCNIVDTLTLHRLMDSSKNHFPANQHRLFSHNSWFIEVVTALVGDTVLNSKNGRRLSTRDVLFEHCREDHNGVVPSLERWLSCIRFQLTDEQRTWVNHPRSSDKELLNKIMHEQEQIILL